MVASLADGRTITHYADRTRHFRVFAAQMAKIICILVRVNIYSIHSIRTNSVPTAASPAGAACLPPCGSDGPRSGHGEGGSGMSRVYGEPVNVQARDDGRPARFVWRGRLYTV